MFKSATVARAALLSALDALCRVAPTRSTFPVLSSVLVDVRGDKAGLSAFDCDTSLRVDLDAYAVDGAGSLAVDARTLRDLVRKTPRGAQIELRPVDDGAGLQLVTGRTRARLNCVDMKGDAFPAFKPVDYAGAFVMGARMLSRMLSSVAPAFSDDPTRYYLGGAFVHCEGERLAIAATNGHLLLRDLVDAPGAVASIRGAKPVSNNQREPGLLVPAPVVDLLARLVKAELATGSASVAPACDGSRLFIKAGAVTLEAKTIDGTFPDYRRILPGAVDPVGAWKVDGADALAFYQAQPAPSGRAIQPGVAASYVTGRAIETRTGGEGGATWSTAPGTYEGVDLVRALQPRVARAAFQFFADAGAVVAELFADPDSPLAMRAIGKPGAIALAMPVKSPFEPAPVAVAAPYEPAFPGMAADLSALETGCKDPGGKGPRQPTARELGAYLADLLQRAGFPSTLKPVEPVTGALEAGVTYGLAVARAPDAPRDEPKQYSDGSFTLLIPGGRRNGEAVSLDVLDESGAVARSQPLAMAPGKMTAKAGGLTISAADVADAVGPFEPVGPVAKGRKARTAPPVAPVAPVEPVDAVPAPPAPVSAPVEPVAPVSAPLAALHYHTSGAVARGEAVAIVAVDAAPVDVQPDAVDVAAGAYLANPDPDREPALRAAVESALANAAAVDVQPLEPVTAPPVEPVAVDLVPAPHADAESFAARLARIEAALGLVEPAPIAKRTASHVRAVRLAWRNRRQERAERNAHDLALRNLDAARAERDAERCRAANLDSLVDAANARAAAAVDAAERAIAERNASRLESAERAEYRAEIDSARRSAAALSNQAAHNLTRAKRAELQRATLARGAARLRQQVKASRAMADGLAVNLQAMTRRAVDDAQSLDALRARIASLTGATVDQPRPSFIMSSR